MRLVGGAQRRAGRGGLRLPARRNRASRAPRVCPSWS